MGQSRAAALAQELSDLLSKTGRRFVISYESTLPSVEPGQFRVWNSDCDTHEEAGQLRNLLLNTEEVLFEPCEEVS